MKDSTTKRALTRKDFAEEDRRIKRLRKQGHTEQFIKGWLRGWRLVGGAR
jgi:hypothetical protein